MYYAPATNHRVRLNTLQNMLFFKKRKRLEILDGFPAELQDDVKRVVSIISRRTFGTPGHYQTEQQCEYTLLNGQKIAFPYRIYCHDKYDKLPSKLTSIQKFIYCAIFTRSSNGYIREKYLRIILSTNYPHWVIPYIAKLSDEYVIEMQYIIYERLKAMRVHQFRDFWQLNIPQFLTSHSRVVSYWNCYFRRRYPDLKLHIAERLYTDYFGYSKGLEKRVK